MKYLYIDTSSSYLYAGIVSDDELVCQIKKEFGTDLSKYAVSEIANLFKKANLKPCDIDKIIVVAGPGSFTGIRIGMTFAKIFAWTMKKDITTITSLEAMATSADLNSIVIPIIDARRGFVYAGIYDNDKIILKDQYINLDTLIEKTTKLDKEYFFVTNSVKFNFNNIKKYNPDILKIVLKFKDKETISPYLVEPDYLKLTEAEENLGNM